MIAAASPMPWLPEAHAVTTHEAGPRRPSCIETCPADMFTIAIGTISGEARSAPRSSRARWLSSKAALPPLPVAMTVPARSPSSSIVRSASSSASRAAATAIWLTRSILRVARRSMKSSGSKPSTSHAMRQACPVVSKRVIGPAQARPSSAAFQASRQPMPSGLTMPRPGDDHAALLAHSAAPRPRPARPR